MSERILCTTSNCRKPATCIGSYEGATATSAACDDCCGHGNEDGWCVALHSTAETAPPADDITPEEIAAIEARCDAATPGPWNYAGCERHPDAAVTMPSLPCVRLRDAKGERVLEARPNQILAAHARTDIPRLLAALRRRDAEIARRIDHEDHEQAVEACLAYEQENDTLRTERDAANAKLARAAELLRTLPLAVWTEQAAALLAEIEAEHGK